MADVVVDFPSTTFLHELVFSFPVQWRGLFAALNVEEAGSPSSANDWLREKLFSFNKKHISPVWADLLGSLCALYPVKITNQVVFWPKFRCLTLYIQRNLLSFILMNFESIMFDDLLNFVDMLRNLREQQQWLGAFITIFENKLHLARSRARKNPSGKLTGCITAFGVPSYKQMVLDNGTISRLDQFCTDGDWLSGCQLLSPECSVQETQQENVERCPKIKEEMMEVDINITSLKQSPEIIEIIDDCQPLSNSPTEIPPPPDLAGILEVVGEMEVDEMVKVDSQCGIDREPKSQPSVVTEDGKPEWFSEMVIQLKESLTNCEDLDENFFESFTEVFLRNSTKDLEGICQFLELHLVSESCIMQLIHHFLNSSQECSFQNGVIFSEYCITSWFENSDKIVSQTFLNAILAFVNQNGKVFVEGVMLKNLPLLKWPQCDMVIKVGKTIDKNLLTYFVEKFLLLEMTHTINDFVILLLTSVLDRKLNINPSLFSKLVSFLKEQCLALSSNLKFAKLVLLVLNKYSVLVKETSNIFNEIIESNNTFLKKSALAAFKKATK